MTSSKKTSKSSKKPWFIKVRGSYLPNNLYGAITYVPYIAITIGGLLLIWQRDKNPADLLIFGVPYVVACGVIMSWIASRES